MVCYIRSSNIESAIMGEEVGLLNIETGKYYILDGIGKSIWLLLEKKICLDDLVESLVVEYDVEKNICKKDTEDWLSEMVLNKSIIGE